MSDNVRCAWETGSRRCHLAAATSRGERLFCSWHAWLVDERTASQDRTIFDRWLDELREKHGATARTPHPWCETRAELWSAVLGEKPLRIIEDLDHALQGVRASPDQHRSAIKLAIAVAEGAVPGAAALAALGEEFERTNPRLREFRAAQRAQQKLPGPLAITLRRAFDQVRSEAGIPTGEAKTQQREPLPEPETPDDL